MEKFAETFRYIFSDKIFLGLFGWCVTPIYNSIARSSAPIVADILLFLVECLFYGLVIVLIVKLSDRLLSKNRKKKEKPVKEAKKESESKGANNANTADSIYNEEKNYTKDVSEKPESRPYREYK